MKMNKFNIPFITNENNSYINKRNISNFIWKFNKAFIKEGDKWGNIDGSPLSDIKKSRIVNNTLYGILLDINLK